MLGKPEKRSIHVTGIPDIIAGCAKKGTSMAAYPAAEMVQGSKLIEGIY